MDKSLRALAVVCVSEIIAKLTTGDHRDQIQLRDADTIPNLTIYIDHIKHANPTLTHPMVREYSHPSHIMLEKIAELSAHCYHTLVSWRDNTTGQDAAVMQILHNAKDLKRLLSTDIYDV